MRCKTLKADLEWDCRCELVGLCKGLGIDHKSNIFGRRALMANLRLQAKYMGSARDHRIDAFATTYSQVYATNSLSRGQGQNGQERPYCIIDVHRIDIIFSVTYHS